MREVRVREKAIQLTYKLPIATRTPPPEGKNSQAGEFLSLCNLVEAVGQCKEPLQQVSFQLP